MPDRPRLHVVLYQPEIPQNTGNVGRTCAAVGAWLWLVQPLGFRLDSTHLKRAGMDYWDQVHCRVVAHWRQLVEDVPHDPASSQWWFFSRHADQKYSDVAYRQGDVMIFGSETQGLPASLWSDQPQRAVTIPMVPGTRSLNLASAAAVGIYEACRQIGWSSAGGA